jgi:hypothetical protein
MTAKEVAWVDVMVVAWCLTRKDLVIDINLTEDVYLKSFVAPIAHDE